MRFPKALLGGLAVAGLAGLAGCGGAPPGPAAATPEVSARTTASSVPPASHQMKAGARAAAARFYGLYSARRFAASWDLLAPATRRQISRRAWLGVHQACPSADAGQARTIKAVTVFGDAAIVTETITASAVKPALAEDVFSYSGGRWNYSPADLSIYRHRSVAADIAAAKAAGLCSSWKIF
jgi:hypothetical protein